MMKMLIMMMIFVRFWLGTRCTFRRSIFAKDIKLNLCCLLKRQSKTRSEKNYLNFLVPNRSYKYLESSLIALKVFVNFLFNNCLSVSHRPTFKTITPTSRTQLKQQLQREQLLQEAERKEAERKALQEQQQKRNKEEELKVPLQSIDVDVPPQILQVHSLH